MLRTIIAILLVSMVSMAQASSRRIAHDPGCNVTMPCDFSYERAPKVAVRAPERHEVGLFDARQMRRQVRIARSLFARRAVEAHTLSRATQSPGVVRAASGAVAHVSVAATHAFQCVVDALETSGYPVRFMGGYARGGHIKGSLHYSGMAIDINQIERNVTRPRMPANEIAIANQCGAISGAQWANGDSGHFQVGGYAGGGHRHYASRRHHHHYRYVHKQHHHARYANAR